MNKQKDSTSKKEGYVLSVVLVVMVVFSFTCASIINYSTTNATEAIDKSNNIQSFWASESAVNLAVRRLELDPDFRDAPSDFKGQIANIPFKVLITKNFNNYTINSSAHKGGWSRTTGQVISTEPVDWHESFTNYVAYASNGYVSTAPTATIKGNTFDLSSVITETVPELDMALYKATIDQEVTPVLVPVYSGDDDAEDIVYKESLTAARTLSAVNDQTDVNGYGTVTIQTGGKVGANSEINSLDGLVFGTGSQVGSNNVFYAASDITVGADSSFGTANTLISGADIYIESGVVYNGAIYASGGVSISSNVYITGSVVSESGIKVDQNSILAHGPEQFAEKVPEALDGSDEHEATRHVWQEL